MRSRRRALGCASILAALSLVVGAAADAQAAGAAGSAQTAGAAAGAQTADGVRAVPADTAVELHAMARLAGVIFAGQVIAVRRLNGVGGAAGVVETGAVEIGVVEIDFAVEDAVRGVSGGAYTLREWAGAWAAGNEPFRVGQRYLMLLHAPGAAGLSSPVSGADGAIPIRAGALRPGMSDVGNNQAVDLRWVATRIERPVAYRADPVARAGSAAGAVRAAARSNAMVAGAAQVDLAAPAAAAPVEAGADYGAVLRLLRSWEKAGDAAR